MGREWLFFILFGVIVQLEERVPCKDDIAGSTPANSNLISVVKRKPFNGMSHVRKREFCPYNKFTLRQMLVQ